MDKKNVNLLESTKKSVAHTHGHKDIVKPKCVMNFTPFVLLIGLGTHAIFEGLALGLE